MSLGERVHGMSRVAGLPVPNTGWLRGERVILHRTKLFYNDDEHSTSEHHQCNLRKKAERSFMAL
jgi:hypothetical protein